MPFPARSAAEGWGSRSDRERVARHVERVAEELARVVAPLDPVAAEGVLTSLLAAAERIRHGDTMGQVQIDAHALTDKRLGGGHAFFLEFERRVNKFHERSRPMTIEEAASFFEKIPQIGHRMNTLLSVGLGYIMLGQSALTLSGGEAQRVKLAFELAKRSTGKTLYFMDEPTTGLHFADVKQLMEVIGRLVDAGNSVVMIEHNLDVIKLADRIIDLGPEGGARGGTIVAEGSPEDIARNRKSYTGKYLKDALG